MDLQSNSKIAALLPYFVYVISGVGDFPIKMYLVYSVRLKGYLCRAEIWIVY